MTTKQLCNLEDLYTLYREDFETICKEQPNLNDEIDFDNYDDWYQRFIIAQAKWVALDELAEMFGCHFREYASGWRLEKRD